MVIATYYIHLLLISIICIYLFSEKFTKLVGFDFEMEVKVKSNDIFWISWL
jgi:hypothetical protein